MPIELKANVQPEMTFEFTKDSVVITHPSGVKATNTKVDVQKMLDACDAKIAELVAEKDRIKRDYYDKIEASVVVVPVENTK